MEGEGGRRKWNPRPWGYQVSPYLAVYSGNRKGVQRREEPSVTELARAFIGDRWEEVLPRLRTLLRFLAARSLNPRHWRRADPSDLAQKTIFEAHLKRADFRGTTEKELVAWLELILDHKIKDEVRRIGCQKNDPGREVPMERGDDEARKRTSPLSALVRHEEILCLAQALDQLPDDQRRAVEHRHLHGLTLAETADLMAQSRYAVARLLRPAMARLLELLR